MPSLIIFFICWLIWGSENEDADDREVWHNFDPVDDEK